MSILCTIPIALNKTLTKTEISPAVGNPPEIRLIRNYIPRRNENGLQFT